MNIRQLHRKLLLVSKRKMLSELQKGRNYLMKKAQHKDMTPKKTQMTISLKKAMLMNQAEEIFVLLTLTDTQHVVFLLVHLKLWLYLLKSI